jgi:hypothetical protein
MARAIDHLGRFEERLGRDTAQVETRAADLVLVDERDPETELGRPERGRVAAGARAEYDEVEVVGRADSDRSAPLVTGVPRPAIAPHRAFGMAGHRLDGTRLVAKGATDGSAGG